MKRNLVVLLMKERERSDWQGLQMGTLLGANLKRGALNRSPSLEAVALTYHRSLVQPGYSSNRGDTTEAGAQYVWFPVSGTY